MKLTQIIDFKLGRSVQGFFICKEKHLRYTRNGDLYLDLVLSDSTGIIQSKMWDLVDDFQDRFNRGDPVAVKGKVGEFKNSLQLTVTQINLASSEQYGKYGFSPELLLKSVDEPLNELWNRLSKLSKSIKKPLRELVSGIINEYAEKLRTMPASVNHHHPVRGGFLKHLVTTGEMASDILRHYPSLNRDLVFVCPQPGIDFSRLAVSEVSPPNKSGASGVLRSAAHVRDSGALPLVGLSPLAAVPTPHGEKWLAK